MAKKTLSDSEPSVRFLKFFVKFWFILFLFTTPMMFVIGLPGIYTGGWSIWVGIVVSITGLITLILVITYSVIKDMRKRKEGGRFITKTNLSVISFVGFCEIIVSIIPLMKDDVIDFAIGFLLLGGGCLTFLPSAIFLLILILQDRKKKYR
jgi:hypothetical protein